MNRRGFLGAMLAVASAPAFVRAESLMKIAVPKEKKILTLADLAGDFDGDVEWSESVWNYEPGQLSGHDWFMGPGGPRFERAAFPSAVFEPYSNMKYDADKGLIIPTVREVKPTVVKTESKRKFLNMFGMR